MARHIIVSSPGGTYHLGEVPAQDENQLQERMKLHPELLPLDEFGLVGPLLVIGRETSLPSGAVDLVGMARGGEIVIIEFKTGPQNSDFRRAIAQLIDYGSDIWGMDPDAFEATLATRYFASDHSPVDSPTRGLTTIAEAARVTWDDMTDEELSAFTERWQQSLVDGGFHYVAAAQRFIPTMERTISYLNEQARSASFYAVELVRFTGDGVEAFEARTIVKPARSRPVTAASSTNEQQLLDAILDESYRYAVARLLDFARGQDLISEWGALGASLRLRVPGVSGPVSIGWLFPPGVSGWMGLRDLTLGHDNWRAPDLVDPDILGSYVVAIGTLPAVERIPLPRSGGNGITAYRVPPATVVTEYDRIVEIVARMIEEVTGSL